MVVHWIDQLNSKWYVVGSIWGVGSVDRILVSGGFQVDVQFYKLPNFFFCITDLLHALLSLIRYDMMYHLTSIFIHTFKFDEQDKLLISAVYHYSYFVYFFLSFYCLHLHRRPFAFASLHNRITTYFELPLSIH